MTDETNTTTPTPEPDAEALAKEFERRKNIRERVENNEGPITTEEAKLYADMKVARAKASWKNGAEGGRPDKDYTPAAKAFLEEYGKKVLFWGGKFYVFNPKSPAGGYKVLEYEALAEVIGEWLTHGGGAFNKFAEDGITHAVSRLVRAPAKPPCYADTGKPLPRVVFMSNGLLDIDKAADGMPDALVPYEDIDASNHFTTEVFEFPWDPSWERKWWNHFLTTSFPNGETRKDVVRMFGVLIGDRFFTNFWLVMGVEGAGKTRLQMILERFVGEGRYYCLPPDRMNDKYEPGNLTGGIILNSVPEAKRWGNATNQEQLKSLTSGAAQTIPVRKMHKNSYMAPLTVKEHVFYCNPPGRRWHDRALDDRQIIIPMFKKFRDVKGVEVKNIDLLIAPLRNSPAWPGELPTVFADAVKVWGEIRKLDRLPKCLEGERWGDAQAEQLDPVEVYLDETGAHEELDAPLVEKKPYFDEFLVFLKERGLTWEEGRDEKERMARFTQAVKTRLSLVGTKKVRLHRGKDGVACFTHLALKEKGPDDAVPLASVAEERLDDFDGVAVVVSDATPPPPEDAPEPAADDWKPAEA